MAGGTGTVYPVSGSQIGLAVEKTRGTLEAAPQYMFPITSPKYDPMQTYIPDQTLQGSAVKTYAEILGMRYDKHGWTAPVYLDSFPIILAGILGSPDTLVTAPTANTLAAAALPGATTLTLTTAGTAGTWITVGTYPTLETHLVTAVTSVTPFTATLATPLIYAQADGATVTGLTAHKSSLNNTGQFQPYSLSLWDNDNEEWRSMTGCQLGEVSIKGNATGLVEYTVTLMGNPATKNVAAPSVAYTGTLTVAPWTFTFLLGGTQVQSVEDWEITLNRDTKEVPALTGTQEYLEYFADMLDITAKITFDEQSGSPYLEAYENGVEQSIDMTLFDMKTGFALNLHSSNAAFTTGSLERGNAEWVKVPIDVQPLPTAADALDGGVSPILATVANSITTAYAPNSV